MNEKLLIVDDEKLVRWSLRQKCEEWGYKTLEASTGGEALALAKSENLDLILLDVRLPDMSGLSVFKQVREIEEDCCAVIMITAVPQLEEVKAAIRMGAYDFIGKPLDFDELRNTVKNALETKQLRSEVQSLRGELRSLGGFREVVAVAARTQQLMSLVRKVAASEARMILLQGESGTGKDLLARTIHMESPRRDKPFVTVNCPAIPETLLEAELFGHEKGAFTDAKITKKGLIESANGGTLFLDEIGELSQFMQAKLLRVLDDHVVRRVGGIRDIPVDIRVVSASNRNLEQAFRDGQFREDLYYRLAVFSVFVPALRERKEDILPLVEFFITHYNRKFGKSVRGLSDAARSLLCDYDWPGNVRELRNAVERGMILEDEALLRPSNLPFSVTRSFHGLTAFQQASASVQCALQLPDGRALPPLSIPEQGTSLEEVERRIVELALNKTGGNQTQAANLLDISRDALRYKIKKFRLSDEVEEELETSANL